MSVFQSLLPHRLEIRQMHVGQYGEVRLTDRLRLIGKAFHRRGPSRSNARSPTHVLVHGTKHVTASDDGQLFMQPIKPRSACLEHIIHVEMVNTNRNPSHNPNPNLTLRKHAHFDFTGCRNSLPQMTVITATGSGNEHCNALNTSTASLN